MKIRTILQSVGRRWYILVAGLVVTGLLCVFAYDRTLPVYQRSASELLVPGGQTVPTGGNPFLYLGGLDQASDVLVTALGASDVQGPLQSEFPGVTVTVDRDVSTSGPIVVITASGQENSAVVAVFHRMLTQAPVTLVSLQEQANVPSKSRISLLRLTVDGSSTVNQKGRLQVAALVAAAGIVGTFLLLALIDGLLLMPRFRRLRDADAAHPTKSADRPGQSQNSTPLPSNRAATASRPVPPAVRRQMAGRRPHNGK